MPPEEQERLLVGFADQGCPVTDARDHVSSVDVVEIFGPCPVLSFAVIDLEMDVFGYLAIVRVSEFQIKPADESRRLSPN